MQPILSGGFSAMFFLIAMLSFYYLYRLFRSMGGISAGPLITYGIAMPAMHLFSVSFTLAASFFFQIEWPYIAIAFGLLVPLPSLVSIWANMCNREVYITAGVAYLGLLLSYVGFGTAISFAVLGVGLLLSLSVLWGVFHLH